jgi:hypothetical protein
MPQVMRYKITATVEFDADGPYSYAEAVQLADVRLARLDMPGDKSLNGIKQVKVTALNAERK